MEALAWEGDGGVVERGGVRGGSAERVRPCVDALEPAANQPLASPGAWRGHQLDRPRRLPRSSRPDGMRRAVGPIHAGQGADHTGVRAAVRARGARRARRAGLRPHHRDPRPRRGCRRPAARPGAGVGRGTTLRCGRRAACSARRTRRWARRVSASACGCVWAAGGRVRDRRGDPASHPIHAISRAGYDLFTAPGLLR